MSTNVIETSDPPRIQLFSMILQEISSLEMFFMPIEMINFIRFLRYFDGEHRLLL